MFETAGSDEFGGDAALGSLAAGLDGLRSEDRTGWSSGARSARVREIGQLVEGLRAELVRAVSVWDGNGDYAADGSLNATVWLTHRIPATRTDAARLVVAYRELEIALHFTHGFRLVPFDPPAAEKFAALKRQRIRIGTQDLKIAAMALANDATLLSRNLKDFSKVPGLKVQNWLD